MTTTETKSLKLHLDLINVLFELQKRVERAGVHERGVERCFERLQNLYEHQFVDGSLIWHNPLGETYTETRTDCEADIAGDSVAILTITEVIKPIIYHQNADGHRVIVQKALVIVT